MALNKTSNSNDDDKQQTNKQTNASKRSTLKQHKMSRRNSLIDPSTLVASGEGLKCGKVGEESKFRVDGTDGGLALTFHIDGPAKPSFETHANTDLSLNVSYLPHVPGDYKLSLLWYGKHIQGSPFHVTVDGPKETLPLVELVKRVNVCGLGLDCGRKNQFNNITIDCRRAMLSTSSKLRCSIKSPPRCSAVFKLVDNDDGTYVLSYKPTFVGTYKVNIRVDDVHVPGSPFDVAIKS